MIETKNQRFYQNKHYGHEPKAVSGIFYNSKFYNLEIERLRSRSFIAEEYTDLGPTIHACPHYHLALVTDNSGSWIDGRGIHCAAENELLLIPPYYPHMILACRSETYRMIILTFRYRCNDEFIDWSFEKLVECYTGRAKLNLPLTIKMSPVKAAQLEEIMERLLDELLSFDPLSGIAFQENFLKMINFVYRLGKGRDNRVPQKNIIGLKKIKENLDRYPEDNTPLETLAEKINISKEHFIRIFKREYGTPPARYRLEQRLDKSLGLLLNGNRTISEIARICGFENVYYFSKIFKQHYLLSPKKYRERFFLQKNNAD